MSDLIVLGTDTDEGKSTFCLLWLNQFADSYYYWKPLETGVPDSDLIARLVPTVKVYPTIGRYKEPLAPALAAAREGLPLPSLDEITSAIPNSKTHHILIETFGSALSPLDDHKLQMELVLQLKRPSILICSSAVGAIGRTLQSLAAIETYGEQPVCVVLIGPRDHYAEKQIGLHYEGIRVFSLEQPSVFDKEGVSNAASTQSDVLDSIRQLLPSEEKKDTVDYTTSRDAKHVWHPYTSLRDPDKPLVVVNAQDEFLTLDDGRQIIDGISSWWTIQHGHRFPPLMHTLRKAAARYDHVLFAGMTHPPAIELAEYMLATMPWRGGRIFYSDNGSTAVEVALKMAYQYWCHLGESQRTLFVGFEDSYHGDTFGAMSVSRDPLFFGQFEPLMFSARIIPRSPESLHEVLSHENNKVAAVIIEPLVQGAGGMKMHSNNLLKALFDVTREHKVLFIADEVMTGGGRTGSLWAHEKASISPDLVCAGKTIAGGILPIAATLAAPSIVAAFDTNDRKKTFFHGHSFTAHPLACAVGAANWRSHLTDIVLLAANIEEFWKESLNNLSSQSHVKDVRIQGTIAAIELGIDGGYLADVGRNLKRTCLRHGVLLRPLGNVLYAMPPLRTSYESLKCIAAAMYEAVDSATRLDK